MTTFHGKIENNMIIPSNQREWNDFCEKNESKPISITIERETGVRTSKQNDALHLYFEMLASELNSMGLDMRQILKPSVEIEWTKENVKEYIWRPLQIAITGKESTKNLDKTTEIDKIYDTINGHFSQKFLVSVPFPRDKEEFNVEVAYPENNLKPKI